MKSLTLVETLLVIAIVAVLLSLAGIYLPQFLTTNYLETGTDDLVWSLRQIREKSLAGEDDSQWGVYFPPENRNKFILFKGSSYPGEIYEDKNLPSPITIKEVNLEGGGNTITFIKNTGETTNFGYLILSSQDQKLKKIVINKIGLIDVE